MAPKGSKSKPTPLSELADSLSAADLATAKQVLADLDKDGKEKKRIESNMTYYLQQSGEAAKGSRVSGDARRQFLLLFLAKQAKDKTSTVASDTSHVVEKLATNKKMMSWWSREKMIKELGEIKAKAWIASASLSTRPDPVTGTNSDYLIE